MRPEVPEGFELRPVGVEDAGAIAGLINEVTLAEVGVPWTTAEEVRDQLTSPGRTHAPEQALVVAADGRLAGYLQFWRPGPVAPRIQMLVSVAPRHWGLGLSAWLVRLGEQRARDSVSGAPAGDRVALDVSHFTNNEPAGRLFAALGYTYIRTFWVMRIELASAPSTAPIPEGIRIRTFDPERDETAVHAALAEAFADHWGNPFPSFEDWRHEAIEGEGSGFDPKLWFVAVDGEEVVGAALCRASVPRTEDTAEVGELGVRAPWRRRGVGLALLQTAFAGFHRRGIGGAELGVDAESPTGATRLYERAGMHVAYSWDVWEKELTPGLRARRSPGRPGPRRA
ncbi:MAG TPA: GNAT family N-acetyltransferase [Actinomycetota bacterium]|nr:GNAT family N-acetyltransferase [Actinomycetota bacterium]